jgi:hypothetical protein
MDASSSRTAASRSTSPWPGRRRRLVLATRRAGGQLRLKGLLDPIVVELDGKVIGVFMPIKPETPAKRHESKSHNRTRFSAHHPLDALRP